MFYNGLQWRYEWLGHVEGDEHMFSMATLFNQDLDAWTSVSSVTSMESMFNGASNFNGKISTWDVSSVHMGYMFYNAKKFNQPIGNWDVSKVTTFDNAFSYASAFTQDLSKWTGSKAETTQQ